MILGSMKPPHIDVILLKDIADKGRVPHSFTFKILAVMGVGGVRWLYLPVFSV